MAPPHCADTPRRLRALRSSRCRLLPCRPRCPPPVGTRAPVYRALHASPDPCLPLLLSTMPPWVLSKATDRRSIFPLSPVPFFSSTPDAPPPTLLIVDDAATTLEPRATLPSVESRYGAVILLPSGELCCPHAPSLSCFMVDSASPSSFFPCAARLPLSIPDHRSSTIAAERR
jgi:hypothetical protein